MRNFSESDNEDEISDRRAPRPPARTFIKTNDPTNLRLDLGHSNRDDDDDSLDDSDEPTTTGRSTSSQLTPKPKERKSFIKTATTTVKKSPKIDIDDDERDVFGKFGSTIKPSPRQRPSTLHEDEENDQSFARQFKKETPRKISTDMFSARRSSHDDESDTDDDDDDDDEEDRFKENLKPKHDEHTRDDVVAREVLTQQNFMKRKSTSQENDVQPGPPASQPASRPASRPSSAKSVTQRQQAQAALDDTSSANQPTNEENLIAALQPAPPTIVSLPPKPKTTTKSNQKKTKYKLPPGLKEITSRIDSGRKPVEQLDLRQSVDRAIKKALEKQTLPRPQSARSLDRSSSRERRRRRLSSAYEHVQPKINTNRSINFDELDTSQMRADSSQSIKDTVYLDWLKTKEEEKKRAKQQMKQWKETREKSLDKTSIERDAFRDAQKLEHWRREREEEAKRKRLEQLKIQREAEEAKRQDILKKKNDAKAGFTEWEAAKREQIDRQREEEERKKKEELERQQEAKQKRILESQKKFQEWNEKKAKSIEKSEQEKKKMREKQMKQLDQEKETRFTSAQEAYENWLKTKDQYEEQDKLNRSRRNSLNTSQSALPPFLPGGSQRNTGRVRHVVW